MPETDDLRDRIHGRHANVSTASHPAPERRVIVAYTKPQRRDPDPQAFVSQPAEKLLPGHIGQLTCPSKTLTG
jgi:hypothetical protein